LWGRSVLAQPHWKALPTEIRRPSVGTLPIVEPCAMMKGHRLNEADGVTLGVRKKCHLGKWHLRVNRGLGESGRVEPERRSGRPGLSVGSPFPPGVPQ